MGHEIERERHQNLDFLLLPRLHPTLTSFGFLASEFSLPNFFRDIELG